MKFLIELPLELLRCQCRIQDDHITLVVKQRERKKGKIEKAYHLFTLLLHFCEAKTGVPVFFDFILFVVL